MPIRREFRHFYGREWRKEVRPRILARAGNKCERCGVPNNTVVLRAFEWWTPATLEATVFKHGGRFHGKEITELPWHCKGVVHVSHFPLHDGMKWSAIQLGVAHLNHDPSDNRDNNLAALCRTCHLSYDRLHHKETRSERKDASRPLLAVSA